MSNGRLKKLTGTRAAAQRRGAAVCWCHPWGRSCTRTAGVNSSSAQCKRKEQRKEKAAKRQNKKGTQAHTHTHIHCTYQLTFFSTIARPIFASRAATVEPTAASSSYDKGNARGGGGLRPKSDVGSCLKCSRRRVACQAHLHQLTFEVFARFVACSPSPWSFAIARVPCCCFCCCCCWWW